MLVGLTSLSLSLSLSLPLLEWRDNTWAELKQVGCFAAGRGEPIYAMPVPACLRELLPWPGEGSRTRLHATQAIRTAYTCEGGGWEP